VGADPLVIEFAVAVAPAEAFEAWTRRCATWWPPSHTVSGDPAAIVFEPFAGGRILERAHDGSEYDWGRVIEWTPPERLRYRWHLFFEPSEATEVDVSFTPRGADTFVRLEQTGWDRLGDQGPPRRAKTARVWDSLTAAFARAAADG
jgi:uncharacterized protein YndB with AHSA1/START domain